MSSQSNELVAAADGALGFNIATSGGQQVNVAK